MATAIPPNKAILFGVLAIGVYWFFNQQQRRTIMAGQYQPGVTPVMGAYNQGPSYAARGIQAQQASMSPWTQLGSSLGNFVNKLTGSDSGSSNTTGGYTYLVGPDANVSNPAPGLNQFTQQPSDLANWYG